MSYNEDFLGLYTREEIARASHLALENWLGFKLFKKPEKSLEADATRGKRDSRDPEWL